MQNKLNDETISKLYKLIESATVVRDGATQNDDLFGDQTHLLARLAISFFNDCVSTRVLANRTIEKLNKHVPTLPDDPLDAYAIANAPAHDIRNALLRNESDLMEELNIQ